MIWPAIPIASVGPAGLPPCATPAAPARRHLPGCARSSTVRCGPALGPLSICRRLASSAPRGGELSHFPYADPGGCARTISENPDLAIGVKLRYGPGLVWEYSPEP